MAPSHRPRRPTFDEAWFLGRLDAALGRRAPLLAVGDLTAVRLLDGAGDGVPGLSIDRLGPVAVMHVAEDARMADRDVTRAADVLLDREGGRGLESVYVKTAPRDRSRANVDGADEARSPIPRAGMAQPSSLVVREYDARFEVHPYDGLSSGLFLEHREHRRALAARPAGRALNLFAYTCGFAVPLAATGWEVTNVDVSGRYLEWGRRNLALNGLEKADVRFLRRDAAAFLTSAARRVDDRYDLVILDPPTFGAADPRRGVRTWRAQTDYPAMVRAATAVLAPGGVIFAATNTRALATRDVLPAVIVETLGRTPKWLTLPPWPIDVTDHERVAAVLFDPGS